MSPYLAYFLGVLTVVFIFLLFWLLARSNQAVREAYLNLICRVDPTGQTSPSTSSTNSNNSNSNNSNSNP